MAVRSFLCDMITSLPVNMIPTFWNNLVALFFIVKIFKKNSSSRHLQVRPLCGRETSATLYSVLGHLCNWKWVYCCASKGPEPLTQWRYVIPQNNGILSGYFCLIISPYNGIWKVRFELGSLWKETVLVCLTFRHRASSIYRTGISLLSRERFLYI